MELPKLSRKKIWLPNCTSLGYARPYVKYGELLTWRQTWLHEGNEHFDEHLGRNLGSVAEYYQLGDTNLRGYLLVLTLGMSGTHAHLRFVKPEEVREAYESPRALPLLKWFAGPLGKTEDIVKYADYGALSASYIEEYLESDGVLKPFGDQGRPLVVHERKEA